jgi:hypothetical protein
MVLCDIDFVIKHTLKLASRSRKFRRGMVLCDIDFVGLDLCQGDPCDSVSLRKDVQPYLYVRDMLDLNAKCCLY